MALTHQHQREYERVQCSSARNTVVLPYPTLPSDLASREHTMQYECIHAVRSCRCAYLKGRQHGTKFEAARTPTGRQHWELTSSSMRTFTIVPRMKSLKPASSVLSARNPPPIVTTAAASRAQYS